MVNPQNIKGIFMSKKETDDLKISICTCNMKLRTILPYLNENKPALNKKFNQILIEKAILRDKLKKKETPFFVKLARKINNNEKRICDYFK